MNMDGLSSVSMITDIEVNCIHAYKPPEMEKK